MAVISLTFLGTSAGVPTLRRNLSSLCLRTDTGLTWLFDCGEGTQMQLQRASGIKIPRIKRVFLTHLHADHVLGLPGLLCSIHAAWQGNNVSSEMGKIHIYGPQGTRQYITNVLDSTKSDPVKDIIVIHEFQTALDQSCSMEADDILPTNSTDGRSTWWDLLDGSDEGGGFTVKAVSIQHVVECFGFVVEEKRGTVGRLDPLKLQQLGIPRGPLCAQLKQGQSVQIAASTAGNELITITPDQVLMQRPPAYGRKLVILGDTCDPSNIAPLAMDADVLVHESTYHDDADTGGRLVEMARRVGHSTAAMAGEFAQRIHARHLILTHLSPRYIDDLTSPSSSSNNCQPRKNAVYLSTLKRQAKEAFGSDKVFLAWDLWTFTL